MRFTDKAEGRGRAELSLLDYQFPFACFWHTFKRKCSGCNIADLKILKFLQGAFRVCVRAEGLVRRSCGGSFDFFFFLERPLYLHFRSCISGVHFIHIFVLLIWKLCAWMNKSIFSMSCTASWGHAAGHINFQVCLSSTCVPNQASLRDADCLPHSVDGAPRVPEPRRVFMRLVIFEISEDC